MISALPFNQNNSALVRMFRLCLILLVVISTSCSKEFINPYDPATRAGEWMPRDLNIDTVESGKLRISWTQDIKHIDGYFLRKTINGWPTIIELPGEATSYIDTTINSLEGELRYSLRARAGNRLSDSVLAEEIINVPLPGIRDIDGTFYNVVQIGDQTWMSENLRTSRYSNGDAILNVISGSDWSACSNGAWCFYENDLANEAIYGKLYNWYAIADNRNICPIGWHVPSDFEWNDLTAYLGGNLIAGGKMKSQVHWSAPNTGATNESNFNGFPGGYRMASNGNFNSIGYVGYWWSSSEVNSSNALFYNLQYDNEVVQRSLVNKRNGFSVRCIKD
jgi:uncharacterized protein (TIGR02145 family)